MPEPLHFGLKGQVTVQRINAGVPIGEPVTTKNLWLDQGLNNWATTPLCDLFNTAAKGTGTTPTTEDLTGTSNTYTITNGATTVTQAAGTRNFVSGDIGKLIVFTDDQQFYVTSIIDSTHFTVSPAATSTETAQKLIIYSVNQTALTTELGRSNTYSTVAGDNKTTTAGAVRTFQRTFIFDPETPRVEIVASSNTYQQAGVTVTRTNGTRNFTSFDIGSTLTFNSAGFTGTITAVPSTTTATLSTSNTVASDDTIKLTSDPGLDSSSSSTYSRSGSTVTRVSGTNVFSSADVGKIMHFQTSNVECFITAYTDTTHVTVDTSGTLAAQQITLYGYTTYNEIGFSSSLERDSNLNIRVLLSSPVVANVATPLRASDQLKVTYSCQLTVAPATSQSGSLAGVIVDSGNAMSANKAGVYAIETFATSIVTTGGETDTTTPDLEPYFAGNAALSQDTAALTPLVGTVRSQGPQYVPLVQESYTPGSFSIASDAVFGLNSANNVSQRSLMIFNPNGNLAIWTFLFTVAQTKDSLHTLSLNFIKAWGRDL